MNYLKKVAKNQKINLFGSRSIARFKFRPWKGVHIVVFIFLRRYDFMRDLVGFEESNNITPVIETDFSSTENFLLFINS